jgi:GT2 family glycosyltransferase
MPDVTVVIPTLDAESHLRRCLDAVTGQRDVDVETIVVDQSSSDGTAVVARDAGAIVVTLPRPAFYSPPAAARNAGAAHAHGSYLLHLDADMEVTPGLLTACVETCSERRHVALVVHEIDAADGYWAACKALERQCYHGVEEIEAARFVRTDVFRAVDGYDESLSSGEDWDVHRRYKRAGSVGYAPLPVIHHLGRVSLRGQARKKFSYGRTAARFLRKHDATPIAAAMWRSYWASRQRLASDPLHALGLIALRLVEAGAVVAGMATATRSRIPADAAPRMVTGRTARARRNAS